MRVLVKIFCFFLLILSLGTKEGVEAYTESVEHHSEIEDFFRTILLESECGYTLYGEKPLSLCDFPIESQLRLGEKKHKDLTTVLSFKNKLKLIGYENQNSNYCIRFCDENSFLFIVINRRAFLKIVQENLTLFRDRFGVDTTPESFLKHVLDPKVSLSQLFNQNRGILGILLGYGINNALVFERFSTLTEPFNHVDRASLPYQLLKPGSTAEETMEKIQQLNFSPSIAYNSIKEELLAIQNRFDCTAEGLPTSKPFIRFSYLKDDPESARLKSEYRSAHKKIHQILDEDRLVDEFLKKFQISPKQIDHLDSQPKPDISYALIAQYLRKNFPSYDQKNMDLFIQGMKISENNQSKQFIEDRKNSRYFRYIPSSTASHDEKHEAYNVKMKALKLFRERGPVTEIVPNKLCFRTLNEGRESRLTKNTSHAVFRLIIKSCHHNPFPTAYAFGPPDEVELSKTIPGFAYGVLGMRVGERREIFIDPDYIYGTLSHPNYSAGILVCVELVEIKKEGHSTDFPELFPVDFLQFKNMGIVKTIEDVELFRAEAVLLKGITTWDFYKKLDLDLEHLILELNKTSSPHPRNIDLENIVNINRLIYNP